jgi:hypothetical protein
VTPLNGHNLSDPPPIPEPAPVIAERLFDHDAVEGEAWADQDAEAREAITSTVRDVISLHMAFLAEHGFKLLPPGAVLRPKSDEEAAMMAEAVRLYGEAKKRKGGLLAGERKLILPPGSTRQ